MLAKIKKFTNNVLAFVVASLTFALSLLIYPGVALILLACLLVTDYLIQKAQPLLKSIINFKNKNTEQQAENNDNTEGYYLDLGLEQDDKEVAFESQKKEPWYYSILIGNGFFKRAVVTLLSPVLSALIAIPITLIFAIDNAKNTYHSLSIAPDFDIAQPDASPSTLHSAITENEIFKNSVSVATVLINERSEQQSSGLPLTAMLNASRVQQSATAGRDAQSQDNSRNSQSGLSLSP